MVLDGRALPDPLASYSLLASSMTEPGCADLAGSCYQECSAHWPDLTGSLSLPPDGEKTEVVRG